MRSLLPLVSAAALLGSSAVVHAAEGGTRMEASTDFGGASSTPGCSACSHSPKGWYYGTSILFRFRVPLALGPVIHQLDWSDQQLSFLMVGAALRLYLPVGSGVEPYLQISGGPIHTSGRGDSSDVRYGAWIHGGPGVDLRVANWLKLGMFAGWLRIGPTSVSCDAFWSGSSNGSCPRTPAPLSASFTVQGAATLSFEL